MKIDEKALAATLDVSEKRDWDDITAAIHYYEAAKSPHQPSRLVATFNTCPKCSGQTETTEVADQPVGISDVYTKQAWSRIKHAMGYYSQVSLRAEKVDTKGILTSTDVGYLATNCVPDVTKVDAYIRATKRESGDCRAAFEKDWKYRFQFASLNRDEDGHYASQITEATWDVWQAAWEAACKN